MGLILTEEELKRAEETMEFAKLSFSFGADVDITPEFTDSILNIIASHRQLLSANAELSFKNQGMKLALEAIGMIITGEIMTNNIDKHLYTILGIVKHELEESK